VQAPKVRGSALPPPGPDGWLAALGLLMQLTVLRQNGIHRLPGWAAPPVGQSMAWIAADR